VSLCPDELFRKEKQALRASATPFAGCVARGQKGQGARPESALAPGAPLMSQPCLRERKQSQNFLSKDNLVPILADCSDCAHSTP
jgi:hypothetical protein